MTMACGIMVEAGSSLGACWPGEPQRVSQRGDEGVGVVACGTQWEGCGGVIMACGCMV